MATKKAVKKAATLPSRAREHGERAFGASSKKPGFALSPELDLDFALGGGSGFAPAGLLPDLAPGKKPKRERELNRNVAIAELRGGWDTMIAGGPYPLDPPLIEEKEARSILATQVPLLNLMPAHYLALEALVGPSVVLEGIVAALARIKSANWNNARTQGLFFVLKGFLLRALPAETKAARARLEALYEEKKTFAAAQLGILLYGRPLIEQRGYKYSTRFKSFQRNDGDDPSNVSDLLFCDGDGAWVAAQFKALWEAMNFKTAKGMSGPSPARLFFLGGDAALETELKALVGYPGTIQADAFESYKDLSSPLAVECMKHLAGPASKVRKQAEAWLELHG